MYASVSDAIVFAHFDKLPAAADAAPLACVRRGDGYLAKLEVVDRRSPDCHLRSRATSAGVLSSCLDCQRIFTCWSVSGRRFREQIPLHPKSPAGGLEREFGESSGPSIEQVLRGTLEVPVCALTSQRPPHEPEMLGDITFAFGRDQVLTRLEQLRGLSPGALLADDLWLRWWAVRRRGVRLMAPRKISPSREVDHLHLVVIQNKLDELVAHLANIGPLEYRARLAEGLL